MEGGCEEAPLHTVNSNAGGEELVGSDLADEPLG